jgi:integrase
MSKKRGNGEGSIYRVGDKWKGAIVIGRNENGTLKRKCFYGNTKKEVIDKMQPILALIKTNDYVEPSNTKLGDWLDTWLQNYKKNVLKPTTYDSYETNIKCHLKPGLGHIALKDLKTTDIQQFVNDKYGDGDKVSTALLRKLKNILHGALKQAIVNQLITKNVSEGVVLPTHKQKEIRVFTKDEEQKFIESLSGDRLEVAFKLDFVSGLRIGELLGLTWDCIDLGKGIITVKQSLIRVKDRSKNAEKKSKYYVAQTTKTKHGKRKVPIPQSAVFMLVNYKQKQDAEKKLAEGLYEDNNLVFSTAFGNRIIPRNAERTFARIAKKSEIIGANVHSIRHTYATRLFEAGVPAKTVSELLGHKNVSHTLDIYTHVLPDTKSEAVQKLNYMLMGNTLGNKIPCSNECSNAVEN